MTASVLVAIFSFIDEDREPPASSLTEDGQSSGAQGGFAVCTSSPPDKHMIV